MTQTQATPRTGVIGLGMIGGGVAVSLARSGVAATAVYDIRSDAADGLDGVPAPLSSPADVADAVEVLLLAVVDAAQARDVLTGEGGVLGCRRDGLTVVLLSTVSLETVDELAELCRSQGAVLVDAGVTGGIRAADNGLVVMVGGPDDAVTHAMPVLEGFAKTVVRCGGLGTGMAAKLARNAVTYGQWAVVHEAATIAAAAGVPPERLLEIFVEGDDEGTDRLTFLRALASDLQMPAERVDHVDKIAQKDLAGVQELAASTGVRTPLADTVRARIRSVYAGALEQPLPTDPHERGLAMLDRLYGTGFSARIPENHHTPSSDHTVDHLLANVWARPYLTLRDRRLFTLGVTAVLGRADLLEIQLRGALANRELTLQQLREMAVHGHYYAGWGNGTVLQSVVEKLITEAEAGS